MAGSPDRLRRSLLMASESARLLLVEGDEDDYATVRGLLEGAEDGFELTWIASHELGLELLAAGERSLCIVDDRDGERDGVQFVRDALALGARAPLVVLAATDDPTLDERAHEAGAADFLAKPDLDRGTLSRSIRHALAGAGPRRRAASSSTPGSATRSRAFRAAGSCSIASKRRWPALAAGPSCSSACSSSTSTGSRPSTARSASAAATVSCSRSHDDEELRACRRHGRAHRRRRLRRPARRDRGRCRRGPRRAADPERAGDAVHAAGLGDPHQRLGGDRGQRDGVRDAGGARPRRRDGPVPGEDAGRRPLRARGP